MFKETKTRLLSGHNIICFVFDCRDVLWFGIIGFVENGIRYLKPLFITLVEIHSRHVDMKLKHGALNPLVRPTYTGRIGSYPFHLHLKLVVL